MLHHRSAPTLCRGIRNFSLGLRIHIGSVADGLPALWILIFFGGPRDGSGYETNSFIYNSTPISTPVFLMRVLRLSRRVMFQVQVFWVVTPRSVVVGCQSFRYTCSLHFQGEAKAVPLKRRYPTITLHGVTTQKTWFCFLLHLKSSYTLNLEALSGSSVCSENYLTWPCYYKDLQVRWVPCHHGMARPQVAGGGDGLQIRRVAANILNK
jgi:hypothetical protein